MEAGFEGCSEEVDRRWKDKTRFYLEVIAEVSLHVWVSEVEEQWEGWGQVGWGGLFFGGSVPTGLHPCVWRGALGRRPPM